MAGEPGQVLKALRAAQGWTLADVKDRTGLPISTLSKLENGKMGLSYDKLMKLGHGLGVDIARFLSDDAMNGAGNGGTVPTLVSGRRAITRAGEVQAMESPAYRYAPHAADLLNRSLHPIVFEIKARTLDEYGEFTRHAGEEFVYVIEGSLEFHCDLYAPVVLSQGDSIYFDAGMGHAFVAAGPGPCRALSISTGISTI